MYQCRDSENRLKLSNKRHFISELFLFTFIRCAWREYLHWGANCNFIWWIQLMKIETRFYSSISRCIHTRSRYICAKSFIGVNKRKSWWSLRVNTKNCSHWNLIEFLDIYLRWKYVGLHQIWCWKAIKHSPWRERRWRSGGKRG